MKVYCIVHHYGHLYNSQDDYIDNYISERDLSAVCATKDQAMIYSINHGLKLGGYCGRRPDWIDKDRTKFGYSVSIGPDDEEWDYYAIYEQDLLTDLKLES